MNKTKLSIICLFILFGIGCENSKKGNKKELSIEKQNKINEYLKKESTNTLGLAVAVIKDGDVVYESYLGKEDLNNKPVNKETIFPLYSLSKLITSTAIFQLIEEDKTHLDDNISLYIDALPKEWQTIKVKHLLTHSSGLPDYDLMKGDVADSITFKSLTQNKLRFKKGERWEYNQTNFWFLTKIIERVTKKSFEDFIIENQFSSNKVLYSSNFAAAIPNRSFKYSFNTSSLLWEKINLDFGKRANSAGGLNLRLSQFIEWNKRFDNNELIQPDTKHKMWTSFEFETPFYFEHEKDKFLHGWQQYSSNNEISYGFTGGLVTGYRKFIHQNLTIIVLSNGFKNAPIRNKIINKIAGIVDENLAE